MNEIKHFFSSLPSTPARNLREEEAYIAEHLHAKIRFLDKDAPINKMSHLMRLDAGQIWLSAYGTPLTLAFSECGFTRIQFRYQGSARTKIGQQGFDVSDKQSVVSTGAVEVNFGADYEQVVLRFANADITKKLSALTGQPLQRAVVFEPTFDPNAPRYQFFKENLKFVLRTLNHSYGDVPTLALAELQQSLITSFIACCHNNYSDLLERQEMRSAPHIVCMVEDYIEANWDKPLAIDDIARLTETSVRSIFRSFQQSRGYSPMVFLKNVRLKHAKRLLLEPENTTVSKVALQCGFANAGRFSHEYAEAFGEMPSLTLKSRILT